MSAKMAMPGSFTLDRPPQTDEELWWTVLALWGVKIPRQRVCPGHDSPFDAFAHAYFARSSTAIWKASRGFGGKTQLLSILGMTELVTLGAFVTILGGSGAQSQRVHETMKEAWDYQSSPSYLLARDPTKFDTSLVNGGKARTLMASTKSVRGPHPQRMRLDEIDEMEINVLESAQGQPMRKKNKAGDWIETNTVMSSTHQYPDGPMTYALKRAEEHGWKVFQWCFHETSNPIDGWLTKEEIDRKKTEITTNMWNAEYELQEPSFGGRAIAEQAVEKMFDPQYGVASGAEGKYVEIVPPNDYSDYITGVDLAKSKDYTVIWTFDATDEPWRMVAFERINRRSWPYMIGRLNTRLSLYGGKVAFDKTGIGGVVEDYLKIPDDMHPRNVKGVIMAGRDRSDMITNYVSAVEQGKIIGPRIVSAYEEHKFVTPEDLYNQTASAHLPDTVAAGALAWSLRSTWQRVAVPVDISMKRARSPWKIGSR